MPTPMAPNPPSLEGNTTGDKRAILVTISGKDRPGITARMSAIIAASGLGILDMEQVVVQDLLSLSILLEPLAQPSSTQGSGKGEAFAMVALREAALEWGLGVNIQMLAADELAARPISHRFILTLIGHQNIPPSGIARVTQILADHGFNIDKIQRLDRATTRCIEMVVSTPAPDKVPGLKKALLPVARQNDMDLALQPDNLFRRVKRLIVFDLDSTLIQAEVIDELAREAGVLDQVAQITHQAMNGKTDFKESLARRVALLRDLPADRMEVVARRLPFTPGAENLILVAKRLGFKTAVISGGFTYFTDYIKERLGLDYAYANTLEIMDGMLTGRVVGPVVDGEAKARLLEEIAQKEGIHLDQVIAVGDGANDLPMLGRAGLGIAFNAKPMVRDAAEHSLSQSSLDAILFLLGINEDDIAQLRR